MADNYIADRAGEMLSEGFKEIEDNVIQIGSFEKEIKILIENTIKKAKTLTVPAAHYFTADRIRELHNRTIELMRCDDFNQEEYIAIFSDSSRITLTHIHFLWERQKQLNDLEEKLNTRQTESKNAKKTSKWDSLADYLAKDGADND